MGAQQLRVAQYTDPLNILYYDPFKNPYRFIVLIYRTKLYCTNLTVQGGLKLGRLAHLLRARYIFILRISYTNLWLVVSLFAYAARCFRNNYPPGIGIEGFSVGSAEPPPPPPPPEVTTVGDGTKVGRGVKVAVAGGAGT